MASSIFSLLEECTSGTDSQNEFSPFLLEECTLGTGSQNEFSSSLPEEYTLGTGSQNEFSPSLLEDPKPIPMIRKRPANPKSKQKKIDWDSSQYHRLLNVYVCYDVNNKGNNEGELPSVKKIFNGETAYWIKTGKQPNAENLLQEPDEDFSKAVKTKWEEIRNVLFRQPWSFELNK
ncbi:MAG: hypothetical protein LBB11_00120, partial [Puniceicoccales bacterium]|nr:hypothetical protein [Puniceicoccales bacterium]